jgi:hypothetical protein
MNAALSTERPFLCPSHRGVMLHQSVFIAHVRSQRELPSAASEFEAGLAPPANLSLLAQRQMCREHIWTRGARPLIRTRDGANQRAPGWHADPARRWLEPGATEGTSLCLCPRTRSLAGPFGRFRLQPAMLGHTIRDDSATPSIGLENALLTRPLNIGRVNSGQGFLSAATSRVSPGRACTGLGRSP